MRHVTYFPSAANFALKDFHRLFKVLHLHKGVPLIIARGNEIKAGSIDKAYTPEQLREADAAAAKKVKQLMSLPQEARKHFLASGGLHLMKAYRDFYNGKLNGVLDPVAELRKPKEFLSQNSAESYKRHELSPENYLSRTAQLVGIINRSNSVLSSDSATEAEKRDAQANLEIHQKHLDSLLSGFTGLQKTTGAAMRQLMGGSTPQRRLLRVMSNVARENLTTEPVIPQDRILQLNSSIMQKVREDEAEFLKRNADKGLAPAVVINDVKTSKLDKGPHVVLFESGKDGSHYGEIHLHSSGYPVNAILPHEYQHIVNRVEYPKFTNKSRKHMIFGHLGDEAMANAYSRSVFETMLGSNTITPAEYKYLSAFPNNSDLSYIQNAMNSSNWHKDSIPAGYRNKIAMKASPQAINGLINSMTALKPGHMSRKDIENYLAAIEGLGMDPRIMLKSKINLQAAASAKK